MHPIHGVIEMASIVTIVICVAVAAVILPAPRHKPEAPAAPAVERKAEQETAPQVTPPPPPPPATVAPVSQAVPTISASERIDALDESLKAAHTDLEEIKAALRERAAEGKSGEIGR